MNINVNGREMVFDTTETTPSTLMSALKLNPAGTVCVVNGEPLSPEDYASVLFCDGDKIELLTFVGGG